MELISGEWGWREEAWLLLNTLNNLILLGCFTIYADHRGKKSVETMNNEDTWICRVGVGDANKLLGPSASEAGLQHFRTSAWWAQTSSYQACSVHWRTFGSIPGFYSLGASSNPNSKLWQPKGVPRHCRMSLGEQNGPLHENHHSWGISKYTGIFGDLGLVALLIHLRNDPLPAPLHGSIVLGAGDVCWYWVGHLLAMVMSLPEPHFAQL